MNPNYKNVYVTLIGQQQRISFSKYFRYVDFGTAVTCDGFLKNAFGSPARSTCHRWSGKHGQVMSLRWWWWASRTWWDSINADQSRVFLIEKMPHTLEVAQLALDLLGDRVGGGRVYLKSFKRNFINIFIVHIDKKVFFLSAIS